MINIVQTVFSDPKPNSTGNLGGAGDSGVQQHICIASPLGFTANNWLVGIGGISNFAGNTAIKFTDPINGDWPPMEHLLARNPPNGVTDALDVVFSLMPLTKAIAPGFVGKVSAASAGQVTVQNYDGTSPTWTTNQWNGAACQEYSTGSSGTVSSNNTTGTINFSGGQTAT